MVRLFTCCNGGEDQENPTWWGTMEVEYLRSIGWMRRVSRLAKMQLDNVELKRDVA